MEITPRGDRTGALAAFGIRAGAFIGEEIPVLAPVVRLGKAAENEIVITDDSVSDRHARLEYDEGAWRLTDVGSTNGTWVEGIRLAADVPTPLHAGVSIRVGGVALQFRTVEQANPAAAREEFVEPTAPAKIRDRSGPRFPLWAVLLVFVVLAIVAFFVFSGVAGAVAPPGAPLGLSVLPRNAP